MRQFVNIELNAVLQRHTAGQACWRREAEIGKGKAHTHRTQDINIGEARKREVEILRVLRGVENIRNVKHEWLRQTLSVLGQGWDIAPPQIEQIVTAAGIECQPR